MCACRGVEGNARWELHDEAGGLGREAHEIMLPVRVWAAGVFSALVWSVAQGCACGCAVSGCELGGDTSELMGEMERGERGGEGKRAGLTRRRGDVALGAEAGGVGGHVLGHGDALCAVRGAGKRQ